MLTSAEINEVQGLLRYLENLKHLRPDDITLIDSNGQPAAVIGYDETVEPVLKAVL